MAPHIPGGEMLRLWKTLKNINLGRYHKWTKIFNVIVDNICDGEKEHYSFI